MALRHLSLYTCCKPYKTTFYLKAKSGEKNKLQKRVNYFRKFLTKSLLSPYLPPCHYPQHSTAITTLREYTTTPYPQVQQQV